MDNLYFIVSGTATSIELANVAATQEVYRTFMFATRRLSGFFYSLTFDCELFHWVIGSVHRKINLIISHQYRSHQTTLNSVGKCLDKVQERIEKDLQARGVVYNDWVFSLENRKTIRKIFEFIEKNTRFVKEIPITGKYSCMVKYIELQDVYRKTSEKIKVLDVVARVNLKEMAGFSRMATGIYGHFMGRTNLTKYVKSYMTGLSNEEVFLKHSQINKNDLLHYSNTSRKYLPLFAIVRKDEDSITVVIRGTMSVFDVIADLKASYTEVLVEGIRGKVHAGIYKSASNLAQSIKNFLRDHTELRGIKKIFITGHSLGAGCGGLFHLLCKTDEFYQRFTVRSYLFAPPPVMSSELNLLIRPEVFSCVYSNDIVPRLSFGTIKDLCDTLSVMYIDGLKKATRLERFLGKMINEKLEVPGLVIQVYKKVYVEDLKFSEVHFETERYCASVVSESFSEGIIFSKTMVTDHKATSYQKSLEDIALKINA